MALPIQDYALIGDRCTAALVGRNGSIDWLCLPRFDSPACLAALLGTQENGHWQFCPIGEYDVERRYLGSSAVLETTFTTPTGVVTLTDLMPRSDGRADVVRRLHGVSGTVPMRHEWVIRLDYGDVVPWVQREVICGERVITAIGGPDKLILRGPRLPVAGDHRHVDEFEVSAGDELLFSTTWVPSHVILDDLGSLEDRIGATTDADDEWARAVPDRPPARGRRTPLPADPADAHPRGHRRHRRRPHHVAAGGVRRRAQLGLPLLLAARCGPDAGLPHRGRLHRGGAAVARLAAAGGGRRPRGPADHVRRGRRPAAAGGRPGAPARLRGIPPGPDRQRAPSSSASRTSSARS